MVEMHAQRATLPLGQAALLAAIYQQSSIHQPLLDVMPASLRAL
jgi:hypothetical protein